MGAWAPDELLPIIPPSVARLLVEVSGPAIDKLVADKESEIHTLVQPRPHRYVLSRVSPPDAD